MKAEKLVITTVGPGAQKTQVWETKQSLKLSNPANISLRRLGEEVQLIGPDQNCIHRTSFEKCAAGVQLQLGQGVVIKLQSRRRMAPSFQQLDPLSEAHSTSRVYSLFVHSGEGSQSRICRSVKGSFVAQVPESPNRDLFSLTRKRDKARIRVMADGLTLHLPDGASRALVRGDRFEMDLTAWVGAKLVRGGAWWRFNLLNQSGFQAEAEYREVSSDSRWFALSAALSLGFLCAAGLVGGSLQNAQKPAEVAKPVPQVFEVKLKKTVVVPPRPVQFDKLPEKSPGVAHGAKDAQGGSGGMPAGPGPARPGIAPVAQTPPPAPSAPAPARAASAAPGSRKGAGGGGAKLMSAEERSRRLLSQNAEVLKQAMGSVLSGLSVGGTGAAGVAVSANAGASPDKVRSMKPGMGGGLLAPGAKGAGGAVGGGLGGTQIQVDTSENDGSVAAGLGGLAAAGGAGSLKGAVSGGGGTGAGGTGIGSGKGFGIGNGRGSAFVQLEGNGTQATAGLSRGEISGVIQSHLSEIRFCHESAMLKLKTVEGRVVVAFTVNAVGSVSASSVQSSTFDQSPLAGCLLKALSNWKFPKPKGATSVSVTYPFIFRTLGGGE